MSIFSWDPEWETGVDLVDEEHRALFERFEALSLALAEDRAEAEVSALGKFLADYATTHFEHEENLMWMAEYEGLSKHRAIHHAMRLQVAQIVKEAEDAPEKALGEILSFLTMWLLDHISTEDKMMAKFVNNQVSLKPE